MKRLLPILVFFSCATLTAQTQPQQSGATSPPTLAPAARAPRKAFTASERGPYHTRWTSVQCRTNSAGRVLARTNSVIELGAAFVKTYYVPEDFETVSSSCPVPLVIAGGKKLPELEALQMAHAAISQGASGVDMGRNIFQAESPVAMIQAVRQVVHEGVSPAQAFEFYKSAKSEARKR